MLYKKAIHLHAGDEVPVAKIASPKLPAIVSSKAIDSLRPDGCIELKKFSGIKYLRKHLNGNLRD